MPIPLIYPFVCLNSEGVMPVICLNCFDDVSEFVMREKFADAVINGTMDHLHVATSIPVLEKGYDLLLEKPFAVNEKEMEILCECAEKQSSRVVIGHVLRYTDFYSSIKERILNGEIGKIISIEMCEHVCLINFLNISIFPPSNTYLMVPSTTVD